MMMNFLARGTAMCPRFDALNTRTFIGRRFDPSSNGWPKTREPFSVASGTECAAECLLAVRRGDLWPADKSTADECGVKFDSTFGDDAELTED